LVVLVTAVTAAPGAPYYVATDGKPDGDGSMERPWPSVEHAPATDFWGRPRSQGKTPDIGAFAFEPVLAGDSVRADWDHGWAYHRHGAQAGLADPWVLPVAE